MRRIAEERRVEAMVLRRLPRALDGVGRHLPLAIDVAETREREVGRRDERPLLPLRVDGAEEEHLVPQDRSAGLDAGVGQLVPAVFTVPFGVVTCVKSDSSPVGRT